MFKKTFLIFIIIILSACDYKKEANCELYHENYNIKYHFDISFNRIKSINIIYKTKKNFLDLNKVKELQEKDYDVYFDNDYYFIEEYYYQELYNPIFYFFESTYDELIKDGFICMVTAL